MRDSSALSGSAHCLFRRSPVGRCYRNPALIVGLAVLLLLFSGGNSVAQVFTVTPEGIEARYLEFQPTSIPLPQEPLTNHNREDLLRFLQAEQGFSMRPLPITTLTLHANGALHPSGSDYAEAVRSHGLSVKAGERVNITDIRIEKDRIVLDFNGGPEHKHKFLRHISVGADPNYTAPVVADDGQQPSGTRIVLEFAHEVPDLTGLQVEALLKPVVDFSVKSPQQAFTDTLPPALRKTILEHHVLVGMNDRMVLSALGTPRDKVREVDGQTPFEEWIYGEPPEPVQFVRFNGNRVIRVEIAKVGEPPVIRTQNEMGDYWNTQPAENTRIVKLGDAPPVPANGESAPHAPPTLRMPGEKLPADADKNTPQMQPVQFPKGTDSSSSSASTTAPGSTTASGTQSGTQSQGSPQQPAASTPASSGNTQTTAPAPIHPTMPEPE
ncbi:hypothetical protein [Silvibacterium dinghuense]|uniref:Uncharacterized protein n=1 Tax=Silvibacterium dinghuense TaxID=1560006 RepID=A0A4Q1SDF8_9BACT|nr:hypothetical protein [Silvibacterium dinghuense]RXS95269.1 hypothetical protein ESZ00_11780 [Silvibacterium dinghuense]GGH11999.1 hypothetical protein GCM10011586_31000 [Silvibacterium dinghuense]